MATKKPKVELEKICPVCKSQFVTDLKRRKYCGEHCAKLVSRRITNEEANAKWLSKKPEEQKRQDSDRVAYSFFRKKYGVKASYRHCRG